MGVTGAGVFERRPKAATFKALIINTAEQYPFSGAGHDLSRVKQGWGLPNAQFALDRAPMTKVINESSVLVELESDIYMATVPAGASELKVTMVYTDRAGTLGAAVDRINDVTLRVVAPDGTAYWGNSGLLEGNYSTTGGLADTLNTVENVFIDSPRRW